MQTKRSVLFSLMLICLIIACKSNSEKDINKNNEANIDAKFVEIGINHNKMVKELLSEESTTIPIFYDCELINYNLSQQCSIRNTEEDVIELVEFAYENDLITEDAYSYILEIETILNNLPDTLDESQEKITEIEIKYMNYLVDDALYQFMAYAETAKASLELWDEYLAPPDAVARNAITDFFKKNKHKLKMMVASDAAGAAAGAAVGAMIGGSFGGESGAIAGAAIGATLAGAASSVDGYKNDCVCITIPFSSIEAKIKG